MVTIKEANVRNHFSGSIVLNAAFQRKYQTLAPS